MLRCSRCVLDDSVPDLSLDDKGVCRYCHIHDDMCRQYPLPGDTTLQAIAADVVAEGAGRAVNCIVGLSGGRDSCYLLYLAKHVLGLRPAAVSFDNGWDTEKATANQRTMVKALNVPHKVYGMDTEEYNGILRAFLEAGVPDADIANDIAITRVLYQAADDFGVKYILDGHCFRTEGIAPLGWTYMDGQYIKSVCADKVALRTFPNLELDYWLPRLEIKRPRFLYHMDYRKNDIADFLTRRFGWQWYGAHHAENLYTKWVSSVWLPMRFGIDKRKVELSALVRSGQMARDAALAELSTAVPMAGHFALSMQVMDRLALRPREMMALLNAPHRTHHAFETYQAYFRAHRAEFEHMAAEGKVPMSFVRKYCGEP